MNRNYYYSKFISTGIALCLCSLFSAAQSVKPDTVIHISTINRGDWAEQLWQTNEPKWKNAVAAKLGVVQTEFQEFLDFNAVTVNKDMGAFFSGISSGTITEENVSNFFNDLKDKYFTLYGQFVKIKAENPNAVTYAVDRARSSQPPPSPQGTCNPSCDNIDFSNATLSAWSAYYGVVASTVATKIINSVTGGACGSVTQAGGPDPNTGSDYQVQLMTAGGVDPIAGPMIPLTPPLGGLCTMVGDGPTNGAGYGLLNQTFIVSAANPILTLQYAVVLENPGHQGWQQPWFQISVLDQNNNAIPGCGQYFVESSSNLPGFRGFPYGGDTVWCKPWVTVFVPLYNYIGQCVTVQFEAADCALGGHFGYGYVAATCSKLNLVSSSNVFCTGQKSATITGPPGAVTYQWSTTNGCISGLSTLSSLTVTCAGTYNLITTSGATCVDTFSINIPAVNAGPPPAPCFSTDTVCSGNPTHFNASCSTPNTGVTYYWDFYNNGVYEDSTSGATPTWTYGGGGNYQVRLHIVTAAGCGADTVITVPVNSTNNSSHPNITLTTSNASSCTTCNGGASIKFSTAGVTSKITITNSCNTGIITISPGGGLSTSGNGCGSISISNASVTITCSNMCPGTCYYYIKPANASGPSKCSPFGWSGDTLPANIGVNGVNISSSINSSAATCGKSNGSASITGSEGTAPYTYTWSNGLGTNPNVSGLASGIYTVTIKDAAGCTATTTINILAITNLSALVTPYFVTCNGANNGSVKVTPTSGTGPYTYAWTPNVSATDSAGGLAPGNYSIIVTDSSGCTGTVATTINQPTQVKDTIIGTFTNLPCLTTGNATATGSGGFAPYSYQWSNGTVMATDTGLISGPYTVTVTDANGCTKTDAIVVTVNNPPNVTVSPNSAICTGAQFQLTSSGGVLYTWTPATGLSSTSISNPIATPASTTTYSLIVVNASGCPGTASVTVSVNPSPTITSSPNDSVCFGTGTPLNASGGNTYVWSPAAGLSNPNISNPTATPPATTTYTVTGTDANGCTGTASTKVTVNPLPTVTTSPNTAICTGNSTVIAAGGGAIYSWVPATGLSSTIISNPTATPATTTTYTVVVADLNGCINGATTTVTVNPLPTVSVSPAVSICPSSNTQLTSSGGTTYSWTPAAGLSNDTISNPVANPAVTTAYSVFVTDANGCKGSDTVTVTINPILTVNMSAPAAICIGSSTQISAIPVGGTSYTYTWTPVAGLSSTSISNPTANPTTTTTYSVFVNDINGCHGGDTVTVTVNPLPTVTVSGPAAVCLGSSTQLNATGGITYAWSPAAGLSNAGVSNPTANPATTTVYVVTATDANGCSDTASTTVTVNPLPVLTVSPPASICSGNGTQLTASALGGAVTYLWTPPTGLSNPVISNPMASPSTTTNYSVEATDANGCTDSKTVLVSVGSPPHAVAPDVDVCSGQSAQLQASGGSTYLWTPPTDLNNPNIPNPISNTSITFTYTVFVSSGVTCPPDSHAVTVTVHPTPIVFAGDDTTVIAGSPVSLSATGSGTTYTWYPPYNLSCTDCADPIADPLHTTTYIVSTTDSFGCRTSDTLVIEVDDILTLYVPSGFTPYNKKSQNDFFYAYGIGIKDFEFYIFNRWGQVVFQSTDLHTGWDGTYQGQMVSQDVYVYLARANSYTGKSITKTGSVTVVY